MQPVYDYAAYQGWVKEKKAAVVETVAEKKPALTLPPKKNPNWKLRGHTRAIVAEPLTERVEPKQLRPFSHRDPCKQRTYLPRGCYD